MENTNKEKHFIYKVWTTLGIVALVGILLALVIAAFNILLLILGGVLIAVYFRGIAMWLAEKTKLSEVWSLACVITGTFIIIFLIGLLLGSKIQGQFSQLQKELPTAWHQFKEKVSQHEWGQKIIDNSKSVKKDLGSNKRLFKTLRGFFKTTFGVLGDIYVMLFLSIFFTATPSLYKDSLLAVIPPNHKKRGAEILNRLGYTLRSWLVGKIFAMIVVAILTAVGLLIMGVPMALALALIAGIFNFVPNFGPIIAMIPAVLVAFSQGTTTVLIVIALYVFIQICESNFITPLVQKRLIEIPPAFIITGQVTMGALTGGLGVILATPILAIIMILIRSLYIEPMEGKG